MKDDIAAELLKAAKGGLFAVQSVIMLTDLKPRAKAELLKYAVQLEAAIAKAEAP